MVNHFLGLGHGNTLQTGTLDHKPTLPISDEDIVHNSELHVFDDVIDYTSLVAESVSGLEEGDSLTVTWANIDSQFILD